MVKIATAITVLVLCLSCMGAADSGRCDTVVFANGESERCLYFQYDDGAQDPAQRGGMNSSNSSWFRSAPLNVLVICRKPMAAVNQ